MDNAGRLLDTQLVVVDISYAQLTLTPPGQKERVLLLRTTDALRLCRDSDYEEVPFYRAVDWVQHLARREMANARRFVAQAGLCPFRTSDVDDPSLLTLLRAKVRVRELAVIREGNYRPGDKSQPDAERRRLVRQIEALSRKGLSYGGRQYRLVVDVQLDRLPDRDRYAVVRHKDGVAVLVALAQNSGSGGGLGKLLAEAARMLTKDWRAPFNPDGLVLLRRLPASASSSSDDGPALTPSQLKKLAKSDWIEIELVDQDGEPYCTHHRLELADSLVQEGDLPDDGFLGLYEIESGTYKLTLGEVKLAPAVAEEVQEEAKEETPEDEPAGAEDASPLESVALTEEEELEEEPETEPEERVFSIKVVDEYGDYVPGVEVHFGSETITSTSSGATIHTGAEASVQVSFGDPAKVAEALALHYKNLPATRSSKSLLPSADTLVLVSRPGSLENPEESPFQPFVLNAGDTKTISLQLGIKQAKYIGLHNTLFRTNSAVVNPEGEAPAKQVGEHEPCTSVGIVASILRYNEEHPGQKLFIAGHTDRAGKEQYNDVLSLHRAKAVLALVEGDKTSFVAACKAKNSEVDVTQLMDWTNSQYNFKCKPSVMDRPPSDDNYYLFRQSYKAWIAAPRGQDEPDTRGAPISETGRLMDDIWAAMFDLYEHNLRQELGENAKGVAKLRGLLQWVDTNLKAIGYGEKHTTVAQTPDGERSDADRRVEAIFFPPGEEPALSAMNGDDIYDETTYAPEPIPAMVSAKKWTAEWEVRLDSGMPSPARMEEARSLILDAPELPAGQEAVWHVYQWIDNAAKAPVDVYSKPSEADGASMSFEQWYTPSLVKPSAGALPKVSFTFEVDCGGRHVESKMLAYEDEVHLQFVWDASSDPGDGVEYTVFGPWGKVEGTADSNGQADADGLPPGGVQVIAPDHSIWYEDSPQ